MEWSDEKCLTLIELYRNHPILWDPKDEDFKNKQKKEEAWGDIGNSMELPSTICKNKMKILLSGFRREKSRQKQGYRRIGKERYRSHWFAFEAFSFLMERDSLFVTEPIDVSIADELSSEPTVEPEQSLETKTAEETKRVPRPPRKRKIDSQLAFLEDAFGFLQSVSTNTRRDDEISTFCKFLENKLRSYDDETKNLVQQGLCEIIFKADSGFYTHNQEYRNYKSE